MARAMRLFSGCLLVLMLGLQLQAGTPTQPAEPDPDKTTTTTKPAAGKPGDNFNINFLPLPNGSGSSVAQAKAPIVNKVIDVDCPVVPAYIEGSLHLVNSGKIEPFSMRVLEDNQLTATFGVGTIGNTNATGEMVTFGGRTLIRSTTPDAAATKVNIAYKPALSPFYFGIDAKGIVFPRVFRLNLAAPLLLHTMLDQIAQQIGGPVCVLGWADMPEVEGEALKQAPIDGKPLTGSDKDHYIEAVKAQNTRAIFFAVVVPPNPRQTLNAYLIAERVFDFHPREQKLTTSLAHIEGALVDDPIPPDYLTSPRIIDAMRRANVKDIIHISGTSTIQRGLIMIYRPNVLKSN